MGRTGGYFRNDGTIKRSDSLYLGKSSVDGVDNAPMFIPTSVITKAIRSPKGSRSAHALSRKNILSLQEDIKNAPVVIDNPARNSIIYVTEMRDPARNYIVATLDKNNDLYGENAHRVTSIHGRENIAAMLEKLGDDATVFIRNENKLNQMLPGNQILKSLALRAKVELDGTSVAQSESSVKLKYSMEDSKGRELTQEHAEYFSGSMVRDDILNPQPAPFTEKETDTAIAENPSPRTNRNTASISAQSVAQNAPSVKQKYSLEDSKGRELTQEHAEYFSGSMVRDDILNLQPTSFTEKETDAAITVNPSPGVGRNTASISAQSVAQNVPSVKQKYSLGDSEGRELTQEQTEYFNGSM